MSSDVDRDLEAELERPEAGEHGVPVDAVCTGCRRVTVKRAPADEPNPEFVASFRHVCRKCRKVTWWNVVAIFRGLVDDEEEGDE
ncbi:hypothetical protein [Haloprofundus sp. MHR1]|uniref:hypothetical protein n=1 Tax=Haloprofundus sp. MHR1 TaxID=2572921 RepID=UPI0010BE92D5|nr:hypothetical protein [Haloprofundus sp. MHR1]QCJ47257.1 hypothetical protein FCF25_09070 [Haloprofundus sp. MHR1]